MYVDTGSQHNLLSGECGETPGLQVTPESVFLKGFGGGLGAAHGHARCSIEIDGITMSITVLVTLYDISSNLILGRPTIGKKDVMMVVRDNNRVILEEDIVLESGTVMRIDVCLPNTQEGEVFMKAKLLSSAVRCSGERALSITNLSPQ